MNAIPSHRLDRLATRAMGQEDLLALFLEYVEAKKLELYPAQEEALLEIIDGKNVILNTPTGSGKSLVATAMHFVAIARGKRSFYTCPIKALVSEKFFALCNDFGPENVGMMTGDATVNRDAPILCCTAEILANMALREGEDAPADYVIMDEFHYYADRDRGVAWQVPLLTLKRATFLLMSATLGDTTFFEERLAKLTGKPVALVKSTTRPVPLDFTYVETPLHETVADLVKSGRAPIYVVNFTQRACAEEAQNMMSVDFCTKEEKRAISDALVGMRFDSPYGKEIQKFIKHGIGLHHAGLLPKYRLLVERLAQKSLLKIICGTDTLGVGVNVPIRSVLFTKLCKFDGVNTAILTVRDFQQISGRAGRKGFDDRGSVVAQAPEHVIENLRMEAKAGSDPKKLRKIVRRKPPDKGYVPWNKETFDRLVSSPPEPLASRFRVTHGMLLNVLERGPEFVGDDGRRHPSGCKSMARLIADSHERKAEKRIHAKTTKLLFTSLVNANVITIDKDERGKTRVVVNADLQEDFSLNHAASLYVIETIPQIDPESGTYALDVLTLAESILENPEAILRKQVDRLRTEKMAELKAAGVEFDERIAELEKIEHPKPNRDFIYATWNAFVARHAWVAGENIRPKSIAREMYETYQSFGEYVREYGLERSEGVLLRYLSDVYKALTQTVPTLAKNEDFADIVTYFGAIVRQVDSSLLDAWEKLQHVDELVQSDGAIPARAPEPYDVTRDPPAFTVLVRNAMFALLRALGAKKWDDAFLLTAGGDFDAAKLEAAMRGFYAEHTAIRLDPAARSPVHTQIERGEHAWRVTQTIVDAEDDADWAIHASIDLEASRALGRPALVIERVGS